MTPQSRAYTAQMTGQGSKRHLGPLYAVHGIRNWRCGQLWHVLGNEDLATELGPT